MEQFPRFALARWGRSLADFLRFALGRLIGWTALLLVLAAVGLVLLWYPIRPQPRDRLLVEASAPDGRSIVSVSRYDNGMGLGLGEEWGIVRLDREGRWFGRTVETVAEFDCDRLDERAVRADRRDARHAVVTLPPGTSLSGRAPSGGGIEVDVRTSE